MTPFERADRAREMLESEVFKVVFEDIKAGLVGKLIASPFGDADQHHEITLALQALNSVKAQFHRYISETSVAKYNDEQDAYVRRMRESVRTSG
jgi:hypothetical protein